MQRIWQYLAKALDTVSADDPVSDSVVQFFHFPTVYIFRRRWLLQLSGCVRSVSFLICRSQILWLPEVLQLPATIPFLSMLYIRTSIGSTPCSGGGKATVLAGQASTNDLYSYNKKISFGFRCFSYVYGFNLLTLLFLLWLNDLRSWLYTIRKQDN